MTSVGHGVYVQLTAPFGGAVLGPCLVLNGLSLAVDDSVIVTNLDEVNGTPIVLGVF